MAIKLTGQNFDEQVLQSSLPVLVDFWADWCGPCKMLGPVIEELAGELAGKAVVGKVNVDEEQQLAARYGVMSIPTVVLFKNGQEAARSVGLVPKQRLLAML